MSAWRPEGATATGPVKFAHGVLYGGPHDGQLISLPSSAEGVKATPFHGVVYYRSNYRNPCGLRIFFYPGTEGSLGKEARRA
jgi:hypothetical protein